MFREDGTEFMLCGAGVSQGRMLWGHTWPLIALVVLIAPFDSARCCAAGDLPGGCFGKSSDGSGASYCFSVVRSVTANTGGSSFLNGLVAF